MTRDELLVALAETSERAAAAAVDLAAAVEHCPGWDVEELVNHLGDVQWFWSDVLERKVTSFDEVIRPTGPPEGTDPVVYLRTQSERLLTGLRSCEDQDKVWTWHDAEQNAGFVLRRQVLEATVHAWDIENATRPPDTISVAVAELGLTEFLEVMADNVYEDAVAPVGLSLEPTDSEWRGVLFDDVKQIVALAADAEDLFLLLWGRNDPGDERVAAALGVIDLD